MRVLLTENEQELRSMLAEVLIEADYEVVEAASGDAAALLLDCSNGFDVLVTDIHMPGRLNGLDVGQRFRARYARSPILYMTGRPDAMRGVKLHPDREAVLFKPHGLQLSVQATHFNVRFRSDGPCGPCRPTSSRAGVRTCSCPSIGWVCRPHAPGSLIYRIRLRQESAIGAGCHRTGNGCEEHSRSWHVSSLLA